LGNAFEQALLPGVELEWLVTTPADSLILYGIDYLKARPDIAQGLEGFRAEEPGEGWIAEILCGLGGEIARCPLAQTHVLYGRYFFKVFMSQARFPQVAADSTDNGSGCESTGGRARCGRMMHASMGKRASPLPRPSWVYRKNLSQGVPGERKPGPS
jgi:hypothetical protein